MAFGGVLNVHMCQRKSSICATMLNPFTLRRQASCVPLAASIVLAEMPLEFTSVDFIQNNHCMLEAYFAYFHRF